MAANVPKLLNANLNFTTLSGDLSASTRKICPFNQIPFSKLYVEADSPETSSSFSDSLIAPGGVKKAAGNNGSRLARIWKEIQGLNNWENLVEPLDSLLRDEIIRYGEFVSACYKAFDLDPDSKRYLNCKYGKKNMLTEVGLGDLGYEVTKYIYATPDLNVPNIPAYKTICIGRWIGYVAVSNENETKKLGRRDVLITFRGTVTNPEWMANLMSTLSPPRFDPQNPRREVKVETGFLSLYTSKESESKFGLPSCREQLLSEISRLIKMYKGEEMSITLAGHSMGSSLALLLAYDIAELGINCRNLSKESIIPITVFSFGGPRVGNSAFKVRCEELGVRVLRIVNANDPITKLPGVFFNEGFKILAEKYSLPWNYSCYSHVGVELVLNFFEMHNPSCVHDLETYINLLKCPKDDAQAARRDNFNFLCKTKEFLCNAQFFNKFWSEADMNIVDLVQSYWTC